MNRPQKNYKKTTTKITTTQTQYTMTICRKGYDKFKDKGSLSAIEGFKIEAAFPRWTATDTRCNRNWCDWGSPVDDAMRCDTSLKNDWASRPNAPSVSTATGIKAWVGYISTSCDTRHRPPQLLPHLKREPYEKLQECQHRWHPTPRFALSSMGQQRRHQVACHHWPIRPVKASRF